MAGRAAEEEGMLFACTHCHKRVKFEELSANQQLCKVRLPSYSPIHLWCYDYTLGFYIHSLILSLLLYRTRLYSAGLSQEISPGHLYILSPGFPSCQVRVLIHLLFFHSIKYLSILPNEFASSGKFWDYPSLYIYTVVKCQTFIPGCFLTIG